MQISFCAQVETCRTEARPQVANYVSLFGTVAANLVDSVVFILQVPVVDDRHHYPEPIEFSRAGERVVPPRPSADVLFLFLVSFHADIMHGAVP